jgi:hypothetical protein
MTSPVMHWGAEEWQQSQDLLVPDPQHPKAVPAECPTDLMGKIRVYLTVEDEHLVAYGFGQHIAIPSGAIGGVCTVTSFRMGSSTRSRSLLVLDHDQRVLLRAKGRWETYGEVRAICQRAGVPAPTHITPQRLTRPAGSPGRRSRRRKVVRRLPSFVRAPGYRELRTKARGTTLRVMALGVLFALTIGFGCYLGVTPAVLLPEAVGKVRILIGVIGVLAGLGAGVWVGRVVPHLIADALRWAVTSLGVGTLAPPGRFFRRRKPMGVWPAMWNLCLVALVPALVIFGPGTGLVSLVHGFRDASLVSELRSQGEMAKGRLIDVRQFSTDDNGNTTVTDVPTLSFLGWHAADPSIGGRPLPLNAADPVDTSVPETVVFLPSDPLVAAAEQQLTVSVWHGAPTANLITGGLFTLALPPAVFFLVLRVRRLRWKRAKGMVEDLA